MIAPRTFARVVMDGNVNLMNSVISEYVIEFTFQFVTTFENQMLEKGNETDNKGYLRTEIQEVHSNFEKICGR